MASGYDVEGLFYLCCENKGTDQLRGYREADLRLCFRIFKKPVFSRLGSFLVETSRSVGSHLLSLHLPLETAFLHIILF